ncbi:MAG: hypothetical protein MUC41_03115 [Syntrophobacteraceae bacterium]|nr:hypothetical protein [Syntrophobacteraceae bacterium]
MMKALRTFCALVFLVSLVFGCGRARDEAPSPSVPAMRQDVRIRVVNVANKTGELFDVDAIGMLWNGIEESLRNKGLLWTGDADIPIMTLQAEILKYQKGSVFLRPVLPMWGKTYLTARCELLEGDRVVASAESSRTISAGKEGFSFDAWKEVYRMVAEDLVSQITQKM